MTECHFFIILHYVIYLGDKVHRKYNKHKNVYEASQDRIKFIFENFQRIYLSFSGGKDSGVMLNLFIDYMRKHKITKKIGVMILDNEANYEYSLKFMHNILQSNLDLLDIYWCCLPITLPCTVSSYAVDWQCWGERDTDRWICKHIGMSVDELLRLKQITGLAALFANTDFSESWDVESENNILQLEEEIEFES